MKPGVGSWFSSANSARSPFTRLARWGCRDPRCDTRPALRGPVLAALARALPGTAIDLGRLRGSDPADTDADAAGGGVLSRADPAAFSSASAPVLELEARRWLRRSSDADRVRPLLGPSHVLSLDARPDPVLPSVGVADTTCRRLRSVRCACGNTPMLSSVSSRFTVSPPNRMFWNSCSLAAPPRMELHQRVRRRPSGSRVSQHSDATAWTRLQENRRASCPRFAFLALASSGCRPA